MSQGIKELSKNKKSTLKNFEAKSDDIYDKIIEGKKKIGGTTQIGPVKKFFNKLELLLMMAEDYLDGEYTNVSWGTIAAIIFVLLYFLNPFDLIPDFIPGIGYIDDATVLYIAWELIKEDLRRYARWKGLPLRKYF